MSSTPLHRSSASPATSTTRPGSGSGSRIIALDLARFLAVVGMIGAHLMFFQERPHWVHDVVDGYPSTLFAVLAGVSVVLSGRRWDGATDRVSPAVALIVRGLLVMGLGLALMHLDTFIAIVLIPIGACLVLASVLRLLSPAWLLGSAAVLAVAGPAVNDVVLRTGACPPPDAIPTGSVRDFFLWTLFSNEYPVTIWLVFVMTGMGVGTLMLRARAAGTEDHFAVRMVLVGLAGFATAVTAVGLAGLPSWRAGEGLTWSMVLTDGAHSGTTGDVVRTLSVALVVIFVLSLLVGRLTSRTGGRTPTVLSPVVKAGGASLTLYTSHVLVVWWAAKHASDYVNAPWWVLGPGAWGAHVCGVLVVGKVLAVLHRKGPLEAIVTWASTSAADGFGALRPPRGIERR